MRPYTYGKYELLVVDGDSVIVNPGDSTAREIARDFVPHQYAKKFVELRKKIMERDTSDPKQSGVFSLYSQYNENLQLSANAWSIIAITEYYSYESGKKPKKVRMYDVLTNTLVTRDYDMNGNKIEKVSSDVTLIGSFLGECDTFVS